MASNHPNQMSRLLRKLVLLLVALTALPNVSAHDLEINGIYYDITSNSAKTVEVVYRGSSSNEYDEYTGHVSIPETIEYNNATYSVTSIGGSAFSGCTGLTSVTLPESVTSIGARAFSSCTGLTSVSLPESITFIGASAFLRCTGLISVTLPESVTSIGNDTFSDCTGLMSVTLPESVISIGEHAFESCTGLTSVTLPESITSIGYCAFYNCALVSVSIPKAVTYIGESAFGCCDKLETLNFNAIDCQTDVKYYSLFSYSISTLNIGEGVTKIPDYFLSDGSYVKSLNIPNSVTSIGRKAFQYNRIQSITLGAGLVSIEDNAFNRSKGIIKAFWLGNTMPVGYEAINAKVNYVANNQYSLPNQVNYKFLSSKFTVDGTVYVPVSPSDRTCDVVDCIYDDSLASLTISDKVINRGIEMTVNNINQYAYYENDNIKSLNLSNNGIIGRLAFSNCDSLLQVSVANKGDIKEVAFYGCENLQTATILNGGNVCDSVFYRCTNLQTATISNNGSIGNATFHSCTNLQTATISNNGNIGNSAFHNCTNLQTATISNKGIIGISAFENCVSLNDVKLIQDITGCNITAISASAFRGCSAITEMAIPNMVTALGESAFEGCSSMKNFIIGGGIPGLREKVFYNCSSLESLVIPSNIKYINNYAFAGCASLGDITFEDAYTTITLGSNGSDPLFADCPLDEVYIGRKLSYYPSSNYGYSPFYRNTSLRTVEITDAETQIYNNEFYGCTNLKSLKIGNGIKTIGSWAFSGCSSLNYFSAGYNVEKIGSEAFSDCTGLTKYYSYSTVPPVCGSQALDDINKWDCTLYVPSESRSKYMDAAQWKEFFFIDEMSAVLVSEIELSANETELYVNDHITLTAEIRPVNAANKEIVWSTSDPTVAVVDKGVVTAVGVGSCTIYARSEDGNAEALCLVTVLQTSGVSDISVDNTCQLIRTDNGYAVKNGIGACVEVYSPDGKMVYHTTSYDGETIIMKAGFYIIRANNNTWKVRF